MPANDVRYLLRLPVELDAELRARAEKEKKSLNAVICEILSKAVSK